MGIDDHQIPDLMLLHAVQQVLQNSQHGFRAQRHGAWEVQMFKAVAVGNGRQLQKQRLCRQFLGDSFQGGLQNQIIGSHRQLPAVLFCGGDRQHIGKP